MPSTDPKLKLVNNAGIDEKLYKLLIARIEDYAIFMLDPNGMILSWNHGAEKIKGYRSEDVIGKHISVFYTEEDKKRGIPRNSLNQALRKNIHESEGWRVKKDGSLFWANVVFTTLYDDVGHFIGFAKITRDITSRKKAEDQKSLVNAELERRVKENTEKVVAHERRFRKLIENSYDGISLLDKDQHVIYRSRSAERINGWSNTERLVQDAETLIHPEDLPKVNELFGKILKHPDRTFMLTYRVLHKLGHYIWTECQFSNHLKDKDIGAIVCNFRDVTGRIEAEEQIKNKTRQIENILEGISDGFLTFDKNFCYTYANSRMGKILGVDPASLIGKNIWTVYPDVVDSDTYRAFKQAMDEQRYICKEDFYEPLAFWYENHIYPTTDGLSVFIRDITERKHAEASLQQSEANMRSVFENTDRVIIVFDADMKIVSFNTNAGKAAMSHFNKELKAGQSVFNYTTISRRPFINEILKKLSIESPITYEVSYPMPNQSTLWYEVRWVSVVNAQKQQAGVILTLKDITEKKLADMQRDRITADLVKRNKDLEQFTYIISHNLRAPVANIQGLSDLLADIKTDDIEDKQALSALATSVTNLDNVIIDLNNILQVSNNANDSLEMVSLSTLVTEIKAALDQLIQKNSAVINFNFEGADELWGLKGYLYSILQNLIVNGIKYHRVGIPPVLTITSKRDGEFIYVDVKDNGKGIDLDSYGQHLFGLYKRFDLTVEGKGMGLFMVKMQMEHLNGAVTVQSQVNKGTTFTLKFPALQVV